MLYLYCDRNSIKLLYLKKTLLGQFEVNYFEKKHETDLILQGNVANIDVLASAIKESLTHLSVAHGQDKDVYLILPQEAFKFLKADIPADIAPSALVSFIKDKMRSSLPVDIENSFWDYFVKENNKQQQVTAFAITNEVLQKYQEALSLLGLRLNAVLPETLALFKLFEKTLRAEKKENIFYASVDQNNVWGYLFDSCGLMQPERWVRELVDTDKLAEILKQKKEQLEEEGVKLNRLILSGEKSATVRQDTFTKEVGVWTNPLKRIIPQFYEDYLKILVVAGQKTFPILNFDVCFGAFVFSQENKEFNMLKKPMHVKERKPMAFPKIPVFRKEVLIFLVSAILSFLAFVGISKLNIDFSNIKVPFGQQEATPTPEPTKPTPTPAPAIKKEELKIKVLNGSGRVGKASELKELLEEKGYQEIITGNADNYDFEVTVIQVKKGQLPVGNVVNEDISEVIANPTVEATLDEDEASDVVITFGADFE